MPITVRGIISYTLTDEELDQARDLRRKFGPKEHWCFDEAEDFADELYKLFGLPRGMAWRPITNYEEIFND